MKRSLFKTLCCLLFLIFAASLHGEESFSADSGFSGMIQAGALMIRTDSQLEPDDDNEIIHSLNESGDGFEEYYPLILFDFRYTSPAKTEFYWSTPYEEGYGLGVGIAQPFSFGKLGIKGYYGFESDVWEDPYLVDVYRDETDALTYGGGMEIEGIMGTALDLEYIYRRADVDDDRIGERIPSLARDGQTHAFEVRYGFRLGGNMIVPKLSYTLGDFDGEANSYDGIAGGISFQRMTQGYMLDIGIECEFESYDRTHPIFSEEREDLVYGMMAMFGWLNPFGFKDFSLNFLAGAQIGESNIDFFDREELFLGTSVGYSFGR